MKTNLLFVLALLGAGVVGLHAQLGEQTLQQINTPNKLSLMTPVKSALDGENPDLAGLEIVNRYPKPDTITVYTGQTYFFTDNAFLSHDYLKSSGGYSGLFGVNYVPYSTRNWTPSISFEQQLIRYDQTSALDFDAQTVKLASRYTFGKTGNWSWLAAFSLQRLYTDRDDQGEFYKQAMLDNEISYLRPICPEQNLYFLGSYDLAWRETNPSQYTRVDNAFTFSVIYMPIPQVRLQPYVRPAVYCYLNDQEFNLNNGTFYGRNRTDFNISTGLMVTYSPIKQISVNANIGWTGNYSTVAFREYEVFSPSITLGGSIGF